MKTNKDHILLAEKIGEIFAEGALLESGVVHYIDSTFSNPPVSEIETVIGDESDCERDALLELLFFPDEPTQVRLEPLLGDEALGYSAFGEEDEELVLDRLYRAGDPVASFGFGDGRGELNIQVPRHAAEMFLSRLNVANNPDKRIVAAIKENVSEKYSGIFRVRMRNSRFAGSENQICFLIDFFGKIEPRSSDAAACLDLLLRLFEETDPASDIFEMLADRKQTIMRNLEKSVEHERKCENKNIETMILQGIRTPYFNRQEAMKQVAVIDDICMAVFNRPAPMY